jgi:hypothetical protein
VTEQAHSQFLFVTSHGLLLMDDQDRKSQTLNCQALQLENIERSPDFGSLFIQSILPLHSDAYLLTASTDPLESKLIQYLVKLDLHNLKVMIVKELSQTLSPQIISLIKAPASCILLDFRHSLLAKVDGE